jgi:predicted nucleic acid-binding protein
LILLDTNLLIRFQTRGTREDLSVRDWLGQGEVLRTSVMVWAEFLCGPVTPDELHLAEAIVGGPIELSLQDATRGADLFNHSGRRRGSLADCLIAATALRLGAAVATSNPDDFRRFEQFGLRLLVP